MSTLLVDICKIEALSPIEGADRIEVATIKGWQCIVGKGQYKLGDLIVFCPPDSIIPDALIDKYNLEFLKKNGKVSTIKLRKQISQGLVLDLNCLPQNFKIKEGTNVADVLGIKKWEPPEPSFSGGQQKKDRVGEQWTKYLAKEITLHRFVRKSIGIIHKNYFTVKKSKKLNPLFDKYTDIENIKNYNTIFQDEDDVVITEKIHGSNGRWGCLPRKKNNFLDIFLFKHLGEYEFCYGSHNVQKEWFKPGGYYKEDIWFKIAQKYQLDKKIPPDYLIYGEVFGPNIQANYDYGLKEIDCLFFDVKYKNKYLSYEDKKKFFEDRNLPMVPLLFKGKFNKETLEKCTVGKSTVSDKQVKEGCVVTALEEAMVRCGRKILKSINPDYLLLKGNTEFH